MGASKARPLSAKLALDGLLLFPFLKAVCYIPSGMHRAGNRVRACAEARMKAISVRNAMSPRVPPYSYLIRAFSDHPATSGSRKWGCSKCAVVGLPTSAHFPFYTGKQKPLPCGAVFAYSSLCREVREERHVAGALDCKCNLALLVRRHAGTLL